MNIRFIKLCSCLFYFNCLNAYSDSYKFNTDFIESSSEIDMSFLEKGYYPPGNYFTKIYINGEFVTSDYILVKSLSEDKIDCVVYNNIKKIGIAYDLDVNDCIKKNVVDYNFDFYGKQLYLFVSPSYLEKRNKEIAPRGTWNDGVNALMLSYDIGNMSSIRSGWRGEQYAYLSPKINLASWRVKSQYLWRRDKTGNKLWNKNYLFAETGINNIKSRFFIGDGFFPLNYFDSFKFKGLVLKTDENMYSFTEREYTPVVRGFANSLSKVEIYQDGVMIHSVMVPAGAFEINDYILSGSNSDLLIKVIESNGTENSFIIPFTSPPIAVKNGYNYYEIALGNEEITKKNFIQASLIRGIPYDLTVFGGGEFADFYKAVSFGYGWMMRDIGAISIKGALSLLNERYKENSLNKSLEVRYNKSIPEISSYISMSASTYSHEGAYSLNEAIMRSQNNSSLKKKVQQSISMTNSLGNLGYLNFGFNKIRYWDDVVGTYSYNINYGIPVYNNKVYLNAGIMKNKYITNSNKTTDDLIFNVGLSIGIDTASSNNYVSYNSNYIKGRDAYHNIALSGNDFNQKFNWGVSRNFDENNNSTSAYGIYNSVTGRMKGGVYSSDKKNLSSSISIDGGLLLYDNHIVFSRYMDDTLAVVEVPGVNDLKIKGVGDIKTNSEGYAIVGYLTPYRNNKISIDPRYLPKDVSIDVTTVIATPTKGAIVPVRYTPKRGKKILVDIMQNRGKSVPFGSVASVRGEDIITGIVGDNGKLYLSGVRDRGEIEITWGSKNNMKKCTVQYDVSNAANNSGYYSARVSYCKPNS